MTSPAHRSGFNGDPVMNQKNADEWGSWRGTPLSTTTIYTTRDKGWDLIVGRSWVITNYRPGTELRLAIHQPLWPENSGGNFDKVIKGENDSQYKRWGQTVKNARDEGYDIDTHLAWEPNGNWYEWSATDARKFRVAFTRFMVKVLEVDPTHRFCLDFNAGYSQNPPSHNPQALVDADMASLLTGIGVDRYDHWPPARTEKEFDEREKRPGGLTWWWELTQEFDLEFEVPEWGVVNTKDGAGDNPLFIAKMWEWFSKYETNSECYFNNSAPDNVRSDLKKINPKAGAKYRELFGPGTPYTPPGPTPVPTLELTPREYDLVMFVRRAYGQ